MSVIPKGRPPLATAEEIIAAYKQCKNIPRVCRELHAGSERVERILAEAGIFVVRRRRISRPAPKPMPENYVTAISEYSKGVPMPRLKELYGITFAQLYRWMDICGVARRTPQKRPKEWRCWHCGAPVSRGEMFCGDQHRRDYSAATLAPDSPMISTPRMKRHAKAQSSAPLPDPGSAPGHRDPDERLPGAH